ncbi:hypothetical protein SAMN02746065_10639 [Desulfocicer vacuolatum DSM 3385]|uniref:Uncharacterized protein n=1 Tax=Desulfocicer vacuolatum DSM 3385 TaxID=1121400 RepID=A0A1W2AR34_9BACT|nr:hypothetical protein [Desulfocicer vacuolatum]SMC63177.1 hypothetical protein SAMN02746065_10639 [Desulfocicer vacuolatum DSM 3385]
MKDAVALYLFLHYASVLRHSLDIFNDVIRIKTWDVILALMLLDKISSKKFPEINQNSHAIHSDSNRMKKKYL